MIKAASPEVLAIYRDWIARQGLASFSALCRKDLLGLLRSAEAVQLIEAACVIGNFVDPDDHAARDRAVGRLLAKWGVKRPRGKRAPPALLALVDRVAPILVAYGVRPATGDNARMVLILLRVASELGIHGDVRGVLRRTGRTHKDLPRLSYETVIRAAIKGARMDPAE